MQQKTLIAIKLLLSVMSYFINDSHSNQTVYTCINQFRYVNRMDSSKGKIILCVEKKLSGHQF